MDRLHRLLLYLCLIISTLTLIAFLWQIRSSAQTVQDLKAKIDDLNQKGETERNQIPPNPSTPSAILSATLSPTPTPSGYITISDKKFNNLDLYLLPSADSPKVGKIYSKKAYRFQQKESNWYQVLLSDGKLGWVNGEKLTEVPPKP